MKIEKDTPESTPTQTLQLIDGTFTPGEAATVILNLIDEKINFHKIRKLQMWEKDHTMNGDTINARIAALEAEKSKAQELFQKLSDTDRLQVDGAIKITIL